jgi:MoaA/NifB/PqqE/SkfB family radical SAM enzyme
MKLDIPWDALQVPEWADELTVSIAEPFPAELTFSKEGREVTGICFEGLPSPQLMDQIPPMIEVSLRLSGDMCAGLATWLHSRPRSLPKVSLSAGDDSLWRGTNICCSLGFSVQILLPHPRHVRWQQLERCLSDFLHQQKEEVSVEPFASMISTRLKGGRQSLMDWASSSPPEKLYLGRAGKIAESRLGLESETWIGSADDAPATLIAATSNAPCFREKLFRDQSVCSVCSLYQSCGGYLGHSANPRSTEGRVFLEGLEDSLRELRIHVASLRQESPRRLTKDLAVLVSYRCVNNCLFCAPSERREQGNLEERDAILKSVIDGGQRGLTRLMLSGAGEPTLSPHLRVYIEEARRAGFVDIVLFTNGHGFNEEKLRDYLDWGVTAFLLSIHGLKDVHDKTARRAGSFDEAWRSLELLAGEKVRTTVNTCLTRLNLAELPQLVQRVEKVGRKVHSLTMPEWSGNGLTNQEILPSYEEVDVALRKVSNCNGLRLINVPPCVGEGGMSREHGRIVVFHDRSGTRLLETDRAHNQMPGSCASSSCLHVGECCGVDRNYVRYRGEEEFVGRGDSQ